MGERTREGKGVLDRLIGFCLEQKLVVIVVLVLVLGAGYYVMPFDVSAAGLPRDPVPVDAIPDIGENQQIVFTEWPGRSPQDVEDQVTYPLTVSLLGVPGVRSIRSFSMFGLSSVYVIFDEKTEFYWSRSRILEKLNSLPAGTLPDGVQPALGPDATALGQVFWYTVEGEGRSLDELRSFQDWNVRYKLASVPGVAEVASVGGFVREYQVDVDPDAMRAHGVTLRQVFDAVRRSNIDVGARTIEVSGVEYVVRGAGFLKGPDDIARTAIRAVDGVPIRIGDVARVVLGPALRRGALDKEGAEVVGGVVVVRHGANPLQVIKAVKEKIEEISPGLPAGVRIVPFYDRTKLIHETLGTLERALTEEVLVTVIVVIVMVLHLRSSILISGMLPVAVLTAFVAMKVFGVDSNLMSLSGIAIAIGTMVDMGIVLCENMLKHLDDVGEEGDKLEAIHRAATEVGGAVVTAVLTTVVSFLPVFAMSGPEGKLFKPLAYTKTFALVASIIVALTLIPTFAHILLAGKISRRFWKRVLNGLFVAAGLLVVWKLSVWVGLLLFGLAAYRLAETYLPDRVRRHAPLAANIAAALAVTVALTAHWLPLGPDRGIVRNVVFVAGLLGLVLGFFKLFERYYEGLLRFFLRHKLAFFCAPCLLIVFALVIWVGFDRAFVPVRLAARPLGLEKTVRSTSFWVASSHEFPGLGREFMPPLDEGSYLLMPTTMPHAAIGECLDILQKQDMAIRAIPEIESVVGKIGRVNSALDPAPISMVETVINYKPEYAVHEATGRRILDDDGKPIRLWRDHIRNPDDIWREIVRAAKVPGATSAPKLQPIAARIVMLQSGMRAPMGVKVKGKTLEDVERLALDIERALKEVTSHVDPATVNADRVVGKPYLEIRIDRERMARYGVNIRDVQDVIEVAIGGRRITTTVEGRERYPVRVRYLRELRDSIEMLTRVLVPASEGAQIPLEQLAEIEYVRGPQVIKSEDTDLVAYVTFDKLPHVGEVDAVEACRAHLARKEDSGELVRPPGTDYFFAGSYENQVRSERRLMVLVPVSLALIFLILYLQFRRVSTTFLIFSGIAVAWSGGFLMLWLYSTGWFLDFPVFGVGMRDLFQVHVINLSIAVWVGFIALFGIASDDGVVMATYLDQSFAADRPDTVEAVREATVRAGARRIRPCLMTTATTILALIPVLTSTGRGADVMAPMAIPVFGGMCVEVLTLFVVPVAYCWLKERAVGARA